SMGDEAEGETFTVHGPLFAPREPIHCEADASSAAVALAAGVLSGGDEVVVEGVGLGSRQPDVAIVSALQAFGCDGSASSDDRLSVRGVPTRGATIDCSGTPDLAPVLAAVGAYVARKGLGQTELVGLETLPGKESSRIDVLRQGLSALGLEVDADERSLRIAPGRPREEANLVLDPMGDHRMAFAFALLSLFEDDVRTAEPGCVAKSWPSFWRDLESAGAAIPSR
ncbi:MAG: hypothetical protein AAGA20_23140, partial [Planctomycetota bacterium]